MILSDPTVDSEIIVTLAKQALANLLYYEHYNRGYNLSRLLGGCTDDPAVNRENALTARIILELDNGTTKESF